MNELALGSLCTGYGGLDLAAEQLLGARTVWCAEFEDAPSQVIAARYPDVPNVHDVKRIPWWIMAPIDVMTAGYPCQPFSPAGKRLGEKDPRHLWPSIAEGIRIMRPRHVLLENVRGHLTLGFDQVLHDLNAMGYAVVWRVLAASEIGACHQRKRLFVYAQPAEYVASQDGEPIAIAAANGWLVPDADLFGDRVTWVAKESMPSAGVMRDGAIYPATMPSVDRGEGRLFPTPDASVANDGEGPATWLARREKVRAKGINGNGMGMPLAIAVQLLPTPEAKLAKSGPDYARVARDGSGGHDLTTAVALLPNPAHTLLLAQKRDPSSAVEPPIDFGTYARAIELHAALIGREAPSPTQPNTRGNPELAPAFVEWMMCLAPGWVTDPELWTNLTPRKAREAQLKMLGNGVVPIQALHAYRSLVALAARRREVIAA